MKADSFIRIFFQSSVVALLGFIYLCSPIPLRAQLSLFLVGGIIMGLPHGGMDYDVAKYLRLTKTLGSTVGFFALYLALASLNFVLWMSFATAAFLFFLLLSAYHFGEDWSASEAEVIKRAVFGFGFLTLPAVLNSPELVEILSTLIPSQDAESLVRYMGFGGIITGASAIGITFHGYYQNRSLEHLLTELCFIFGGLFLPPILFLTAVFCFLHGPRHTAELYRALGYRSISSMMRSQIPIFGASLLLLTVIFFIKQLALIPSDLFSSLMILIACLTTPHMILMEIFHRSERRRQFSVSIN